MEEGSGSFRVPNRRKTSPLKDGRGEGSTFCALIFQKQEGLEVLHKWPLRDEMTQLCLGASVGSFLSSSVLSHGDFMSQSFGKVRHQDSSSAPNGRLQKVSAVEQRLPLSSSPLLELLHDKACALEQSPFTSAS